MWNYFICTARYQDQSNIYEIFARYRQFIEIDRIFFFFKLSNFEDEKCKILQQFRIKNMIIMKKLFRFFIQK